MRSLGAKEMSLVKKRAPHRHEPKPPRSGPRTFSEPLGTWGLLADDQIKPALKYPHIHWEHYKLWGGGGGGVDIGGRGLSACGEDSSMTALDLPVAMGNDSDQDMDRWLGISGGEFANIRGPPGLGFTV